MSHAPDPAQSGSTTPGTAAPGGAAPAAPVRGADGAAPAAGDPAGPRRLAAPPHIPPDRRGKAMGWRSRDIMRATLLVIGVYIALRLLWLANTLVFAVFLGVLFGLALARGVDFLARFRVPRGIGAATIALAFLGALVGTGALIAPTVSEQAAELRRRLPDAVERVQGWVAARQQGFLFRVLSGGGGAPAADSAAGAPGAQPADSAGAQQPAAGQQNAQGGAAQADAAQGGAAQADAAQGGAPQAGGAQPDTADAPAPSLGSQVGERLGGLTSYLFPFLQSTVSIFAGILLVFFIAIYIAIAPQTYHGGLVRLFPKKDREKAGEVLSITATVLRRWLVTQLIAMVVIGVVTTVALTILDVRAAFALGLLAGLLEFVPTVGPLISAIPAIAMGLLDSPEKALFVALLYVGIQFAENHLLIPMLMSEGLDIPPALTIVAQALMALIFGFLGLLVAVPLVAAALVPIKLLYVRGVLGDEDVDVLGDEGGNHD